MYCVVGNCLELRSAGVHVDDSYPIYMTSSRPVTMYCVIWCYMGICAVLFGVIGDSVLWYFVLQRTMYCAVGNCLELRSAGVHVDDSYPIYMFSTRPITVYCELSTPEAWIRILHREDVIVSFQRGWNDYQSGFGDPSGDHWLDNDLIHNLTSVHGVSRLKVDLEYLSGDSYYADCDHFVISEAASLYTLNVSGYSGTAGDGLGDGDPASAISNGSPFTTTDRDNDQLDRKNCATKFKGAWWHNNCAYALLTSYFWDGPTCNQAKSTYCILWEPLGYGIPIKKATMKVTTIF